MKGCSLRVPILKKVTLSVVLGVMALQLAACGSGDKQTNGGNSISPVATVVSASLAPEPTPYKGGPRLYIKEASLDFGKVPIETNVSATFHFQNVGDTPLNIKNSFVRVVEGCCPPTPSLDKATLAPGESAALDTVFTMHAGMAYLHVFEVVVQSDDAVQPEQVVRLRADFVQ